MCGIAGFIDFKNNSSKEILNKMTEAVAHRGPDGQGEYFHTTSDCQIGLGHRRLSIIDLSSDANQPMVFDGLRIIFNGEIYNYSEIREELISLGHSFKTHSDTEVILHGWRQWGEAAIQKWRGMFSIVLYDEKKSLLTCIRDRAGVKPFFYYFKNDTFIFGSELKSLAQHPAFEKNINTDAVASFLQYGYVSSPHCIFHHTHKLPAGHLLNLQLGTKDLFIKQYWNVYDYYNKPKLKIDLQDAITGTEKILQKSFQYRMVADVPVGVFLSGGYDSSCVTALLQKNSTEKIKTFTIGSADNKMDEAPFAKQIAERLGTEHTAYYCTAKDALDIIPDLAYYFDEPFADSSAIPTMLVSRLAREKVTVALSADAGDEIFAGYNRYDYIGKYSNKIKVIPKPIRKLMSASMDKVAAGNIPGLRKKQKFISRYEKFKKLLKDPSTSTLLDSLNHVFSDAELEKLFNRDVMPIPTLHASKEMKGEFGDPLSYMMAIDYQTYMVDDILQKVDRATMSTSLEGREPFLDQHIIEWAAQLPSAYKYHKGNKKYILKEIVHQYIPKEIMDRPKMGFGIPLKSWLTNELKDVADTYLCESSLQKHNLFNKKIVDQLWSDLKNDKLDNYLKIWHLLSFQMWYEKWMK